MTLPEGRLASLLEDADFWRGVPREQGGSARYKEWQHFAVFGEGFTLVFNLNLDGSGAGRTITIVDGDAWRGEIAIPKRVDLIPGRIDATFDTSGLRWRAGGYEAWHSGDQIQLQCRFEPVSLPSLTHHIRLGPDSEMSWCMVPRLSASGWFEVDGKRTSFASRPAYHDHNWGRFTWGGDFCWEWGCALPEDAGSPWSVVFARMTDRARQRTSATSVFLLERDRYLRYFRNGEVRFESEGRLHPRPAGRIPPAAALLLPDEDRDVARVLRFEARRGSDELRGEVAGRSRGQVLVPSESNAHALVRINEVSTRVTVEGTCCGKPVRLAGPGLLEVVRG